MTSRQHSSFWNLNLTQFLGALNDNLFKLLVIFFLIDLKGIERSTQILSTAGAVFVLPFLLFSAVAGTFADRYSKRNIIVFCKALELVTMTLGVLAFTWESSFGAYSVLFLMATQSALFGPSKYGIVPEIVQTNRLSKANGALTSLTFLAIIFGTFLGSFITDMTGRNFIVASCFCCILSLVGLLASVCIRYTQPSGSQRPFTWKFYEELAQSWPSIRVRSGLPVAIMGSAFSLLSGAFIQLNMVPYAIESLHLSDVHGGYLFLLTALGLGIGAFLAGRLSGDMVELGLVPIGGIGMVGTCFGLYWFAGQLSVVLPLVFFSGLFGGIYMVPLDTFIQYSSPSHKRGQVLALSNFVGFAGVLLASVILFVTGELLGLSAAGNFLVLGWLILGMTSTIVFLLYDHLVRYLGMLMARLQFKVTIHGDELLPVDAPALFLCQRTAWNDALLLLGSQRTRVRFFTNNDPELSRRRRRIQKLLKVSTVPAIQEVDSCPKRLEQIKRHLRRGISVCLFVDEVPQQELDRLIGALQDQQHLRRYALISVAIDRQQRESVPVKLMNLLPKWRIPTEVQFQQVLAQPA